MEKSNSSTDNYKKIPPPPPPPPDETLAGPYHNLPSWEDPAILSILNNLQGNIVNGHGRDHVRLIFLRFNADKSTSKAAIRDFLSLSFVQSASEQLKHRQRFRDYGVPGPVFSNFLLSAAGYIALGFSDLSVFKEDGPELPHLRTPQVTFAKGAKHSDVLAALSDPPVETWEKAFRGDIHALVILADDELGRLASAVNATIQKFENAVEVLLVQSGDAIRNKQGDTIEHFGYIDGRSQPIFFKEELDKEIRELDTEDPGLAGPTHYTKFNPTASLDLVLVKGGLAKENDCFGSYFVFRKLEQNVRAFKQQEQALANTLGLSGEKRKLAGAYVVGRFEDGTPTVMRNEPGLRDPIPNNFDYATDPEGQKVPFHAHIRKMNPRGDIPRTFSGNDQELAKKLQEEERRRRVARRGITYGDQTGDPTDPANISSLPTHDVGLLFMCFQSNIPTQFAFLQNAWANGDEFLKKGTGIDPLIGQQRDVDKPVAQRCPLSWDQMGSIRSSFSGFVTMKGGEFFFAPSIPFLKEL